MPPLKQGPTSTPTDEHTIHPFLQEVPPPAHADDCRSQSSVHFRILYLTLAVITVLEVCIVAFVATPHNAAPIAPDSEVPKKQELPDHFPSLYCNGTSELPFPLSSDKTDASRFLVVCLEDDAVAFCLELSLGVLTFRCGPQIGGPSLPIKQYLEIMGRVSECIAKCKPPDSSASMDTLTYAVGAGIRLNIDLTENTSAVVGIHGEFSLVEFIKCAPMISQNVTLTISQLMCLVDFSTMIAEQSADMRILGRLGPQENPLYGRNGPFNRADKRHLEVVQTAEEYQYDVSPTAEQTPMPAEDGLVAAIQGTTISIYSIAQNIGRKVIDLNAAEYVAIVKNNPLLTSLLGILSQLPNPIECLMPVMTESDQKAALHICLDKLGLYLRFTIQVLAERACMGCVNSRRSTVTNPYVNHQHFCYEDNVDIHIRDASTQVLCPAGRMKLRTLVFGEPTPLNVFVLSLVFNRLMSIYLSTELLTYCAKYHGVRPLSISQKLYTDILLDLY